MSVKIAPAPRQQFTDANGVPYSGAKLFTYAAGSTTKQTTYTTSVGDVANTNPIILDSAGRTPYGRWYTSGLAYKEVLAPSTDTDPPTSPIFTEDNISGVNDTSVSTSEWKASGATPTYIGATQFSVVGDQTTELHVNRRLKLTVSAGTVYGKISVSAYTTVTTITVVLDSGVLDSGLSAVEWSILSANDSAVPSQLRGTSFSGLVGFSAGANIASAATIDLTSATGNSPRITGTVATSTVTMNAGQQMLVVADGAWPLTYNATTNRLNTGADYTCKAGDTILYYKDLSGVVHGEIIRPTGVAAGNVLQVDKAQATTATATTVNLSAAILHTLTGTNTVTAFNGVSGVTYHCTVSNPFTLTHSVSLNILQTAANISAVQGDTFDVYMQSSTECVLFNFQKASGYQVKENNGSIIQSVFSKTTAVNAGTTVMPVDDTIPQNTEGDEYITITITPTSATNKLRVQVSAQLTVSTAVRIAGALFRDTTAGAFAAAGLSGSTDDATQLSIEDEVVAGSTSQTTFKFRAGPQSAATVTINGISTARRYGGVCSSFMKVTEIKA